MSALLTSACVAALVVPAIAAAATSPPSTTSAFTPTSIAVGGTSSLSVTITNPNSSGSLSGVAFTDTLPANLVVDNPSGESGTCGSSSTVTASPGASTISLTGGSISAGSSCTISVNVTSNVAAVYQNSTGAVTSSNGGSGNSDTESLTVVAPPTVTVSAPRNNATYNFAQRVITRFGCSEAANGPGLASCSGDVDGAGLELTSGAPLPTSVAGPHQFTITAISEDGQLVTDTINYKVRPDNRFTVSHVKAGPNGSVSLRVKVPGAGATKVRELSGRSTFGESAVNERAARTVTVTVRPNARGAVLLSSHPSGLTIRIQVTYTPTGGIARKTIVYGVRVS